MKMKNNLLFIKINKYEQIQNTRTDENFLKKEEVFLKCYMRLFENNEDLLIKTRVNKTRAN